MRPDTHGVIVSRAATGTYPTGWPTTPMRKHGRKIALKYARLRGIRRPRGAFLTKPHGRVLEDMPERLARSEAVATRARALAVTVPPSSRDTVIATAWLYGGRSGFAAISPISRQVRFAYHAASLEGPRPRMSLHTN